MIEKLLIVGNGFDLAHGLHTKYSDFKKYIGDSIKKDEGINIDDQFLTLEDIPQAPLRQIHCGMGEQSRLVAEYKQEKKVLYWLIDDVATNKQQMEWNEFESYLGELDFMKIIESWGNDEESIMCLWEVVSDLDSFFFEWVNYIDLDDYKCKPYTSLINNGAVYALSLNYTETLEKLYDITPQNICHIHGKRETETTLQKEKSMTRLGKDNSELIIGCDEKKLSGNKQRDKIMPLYSGLIKETSRIIHMHNDFWEKIRNSNIREIYTIGFSFSEVDQPYIEKICSIFNENEGTEKMIWYLSDYNSCMDRLKFRTCLRKSKFKGKIRVFRTDKATNL